MLEDVLEWVRWNELVAATDSGSIDPWCTSSDWAQSAHGAFNPAGELVCATEGDSGFAFATAPQARPHGGALLPLEPMWLFGAPIVGADPVIAASFAERTLSQRGERSVYLGGYVEGSPWWDALIGVFGVQYRLFGGEERVRCRASLEGGIDGYLGRRTRVFRRNIRQGEKRATSAGITFEVLDSQSPEEVLDRLHRVEQQSWKGLDGSGIEGPDMAMFYSYLLPRLHDRKALRVCVGVDDAGTDIGFIFGGVFGGTYRGLQLSFTESARSLGVGNLLQWHELQRLCQEDLHTYDIGMDMEYKRLWTEQTFTTRLMIAQR
jgi:hypothetical protein